MVKGGAIMYTIAEWWRKNPTGRRKFHEEWSGKSLIKALLFMRKLRKNGATRLKLEWRA